jgi:KTSC domain
VDREFVTSSNIRSVGYDSKSETLEIEFNNGTVYQYYNVPSPVFDELMMAPSVGKFFNSQIKNSFPYARV